MSWSMILRPLWMPNSIGWCFRLTLQMFLTLFRINPFPKNFGQWEGNCLNFSLFVFFKDLLYSSFRALVSHFFIYGHMVGQPSNRVSLRLCSFLHCSSRVFLWCLFPCLASDTHIFNFPMLFISPLIILLPSWFQWGYLLNLHYCKFWVLQLFFPTKIQLHATHATTNLCTCIKQVEHDIQLHAKLGMQHIYMVLIYMFIHTYQSKCSYTLCATLFATIIQLIKI